MNSHSGSTLSVWMKTGEIPVPPKLTENISADVCVVGAGIAGMSTAFLLACEGKTVAVLDDGPIAGGETERTTAHLVCALDDRYFNLEHFMGKKAPGWRRRAILKPSIKLRESWPQKISSVSLNGLTAICSFHRVNQRKFWTANWPLFIAQD
jgi:glycine/D-amino acid oxidase-like deaminating enzyme